MPSLKDCKDTRPSSVELEFDHSITRTPSRIRCTSIILLTAFGILVMLGIALLLFRIVVDIQGDKLNDNTTSIHVAIVRRLIPGMRT